MFVAGGDAGLYVFRDAGAPSRTAASPSSRRRRWRPAPRARSSRPTSRSTTPGRRRRRSHFEWLPRGEDNSEPIQSEPIALAPGQSLRYENVLTELFDLEPDSLGALKMVASTESVIGMSRTYNSPAGETAGTFGQGLPAIRATEMIQGSEPQRIIFLSENDDSRANVGCVNGSSEPVTINIGIFDAGASSSRPRPWTSGPTPTTRSTGSSRTTRRSTATSTSGPTATRRSTTATARCSTTSTSDPTTILPQVPSDDTTFIPAAALAAGLEGAFFQTDVDLNNVGSTDLTYQLLWLPRGADNSDPVSSDTFWLAPGAGVRYANVLDEVFGLEPDQVGALAIEASGIDLLAMSRTYNLPSAKVAGTFGQELPGIPADRMIADRGEEADHLHERERRRPGQRRLHQRRRQRGRGADRALRLGRGQARDQVHDAAAVLQPADQRDLPGLRSDQRLRGRPDLHRRTPRSTATARCSTT